MSNKNEAAIDVRLTDERVDRALTIFEARADQWAVEVDLPKMIGALVSPMNLSRSAPDHVRDSFAGRMIEQIDAIVKQAYIEGAYSNHCLNADIVLPCDVEIPGQKIKKGSTLSQFMRELCRIAKADSERIGP